MSIGYGDNDEYPCYLLIRRKTRYEDATTIVGEFVSYEDAVATRDRLVAEYKGYYTAADYRICSGNEDRR